MDPTANRPPVVMTIHQMFERLTAILEAATPEERERFRKNWLAASEQFDADTARMRGERLLREWRG
jgi:hypothetical protein